MSDEITPMTEIPALPEMTPMLRQYLDIKAQYQDAILFYRMGDFYEMFYEDAQIASKELEIALTTRNKNQKEQVPLCGIPHHALNIYLCRMIEKGYKVAICEQVEDPKKAKGIVRREVIRVVTPGTLLESENLDAKSNQFLLSIAKFDLDFGLATVDLSTGEVRLTNTPSLAALIPECLRFEPRELVIQPEIEASIARKIRENFPLACINPLESSYYSEMGLENELCQQYQVASVAELGLNQNRAVMLAFIALLRYLRSMQKTTIAHLKRPEYYESQNYLVLNESTVRNLELFRTLTDGKKKGSLLGILDETKTSMGGRKLKQWLMFPLIDEKRLSARHDAVEELAGQIEFLEDIQRHLKQCGDIERLTGKISLNIVSPRELIALRNSLEMLPGLVRSVKALSAEIFSTLSLETGADIATFIRQAIADEPSLSVKEGGIIQTGYNAELDELRYITREGKGIIAELEAKEREKTGINSLKIRYNRVFGYYIEVTRANFNLVPDYFIRKQTLANAERFVTPDLKEYEEKVLTAEEKSIELEYELYLGIRDRLKEYIGRLQDIAQNIATLDVLGAFAVVARRNNYVKPLMNSKLQIDISAGRHPVIEQMQLAEGFVPNDIHLDNKEEQILIITGPNMAGKSTIMRQVALIVLMAQIGSFVPARSAKIGIVDRIFTRVGATDNLSRGQSTFMVEMMEAAEILKNATRRSLIILDEIGRGTSTFDGVSIAWAVAEYIHDNYNGGVKTLFATHYHQLTDLADNRPRIKNYNVAIKEWKDEIIFLRKLIKGGTSRSYGIEVARLAGVPKPILDRAREVLHHLEKIGLGDTESAKSIPGQKPPDPDKGRQLSLFEPKNDAVRETLRAIDINALTPLDALMKLKELKELAERS